MSVPILSGTSTAGIYCYTEGVSEESKTIRATIKEISCVRPRAASYAWRDSLANEIRKILQDCSTDGWDGYDAVPVSRESALDTAKLIELLPEGIQIPNVVPEPTGDISLEWLAVDQKHFTLSAAGQSLIYAGIFGGTSKSYGEERFIRVLPRTILEILASYFSKA